MCAYGPMILGYGHPAVEAAVAEQLAGGDCLPLPGPRMVELAERLVALTPRADFAVFGKNGADATSWAVDVARAHTGRPRIARVRGAYHAARPVGPAASPRRPGALPRRPARVRVERPRRAGRPLRRAPGRDRGGHDGPVRPPDRRRPRPRLLRRAPRPLRRARRALRDGRRARGLPLQPGRLLRALRGRARPDLLLQGHRQRPRALGRARPGSAAPGGRAHLLHRLVLLRERRLRGRAGHPRRPGAHRRDRAHPADRRGSCATASPSRRGATASR